MTFEVTRIAQLESQIKELQDSIELVKVVNQTNLKTAQERKAVIDEIKEYVNTSNLQYFSEVGGLKEILAKLETK